MCIWVFCLNVCLSTTCMLDTCKVSIPWMLHKVVCNYVDSGIEPGSCGRATSALNH